MSIHKAKDRRTYRYRFFIYGKKYQDNTGQQTEADAREWEEREQRRIRRALAGLPVLVEHGPRMSVWASVYLKYVTARGKIRRIDRVEELLRVVLRFWGAPPRQPIAGAPYHDLTLADPIRDPDWIEKFDDWIRNRKIRIGTDEDGDPITRPPSAQTRLHYMSIMSRMYPLIQSFATSPSWSHKTVGRTGLPMVVAISDPLRRVLKTLKQHSTSPWVIAYRGRRVKEIRRAIRQGAEAAGLTYGRDVDGVTFHTIRHMAATELADVPGLTEAQRSATMGQDVRTTQMYTHLRPESQRPVVNALAARLDLDDVIGAAFGVRPQAKPEAPDNRTRKNPVESVNVGRRARSSTSRKRGHDDKAYS